MPSITVPAPPALVTVPGVELMHTGQWDALTGTHTFTAEDLAAAVAAVDCPAVRRPVLKFGHDSYHGQGIPALGSVGNMRLKNDGRTLAGDYVGMPGWLGATDDEGRSVLSSAYPDRSIEGEWNYRCQIGHLHPFAIHAVALLGVERPGIGTLPSLADLAATYGVALSNPEPTGTPVVLTVRDHATDIPSTDTTQASTGPGGRSPMPNPSPLQVSAAVTSDDVRRAYYDTAAWEYWITEMQLDPALQLIVTSEEDGSYSRVPVTVDGDDITFGTPIPVSVVYVDKTTGDVAQAAAMTVMASAAASGRRVAWASRAESRPGDKAATAESTAPADVPTEPALPDPPVEPQAPEVPKEAPEDVPAAEPDAITNQEDDMSLSAIRARLGLGDDADEAAVLAALNAKLPTESGDDTSSVPEVPAVQPTPAPAAASTKTQLPDGVVAIDAATLDELRRNATLGAQAAERQRVSDRDRVVDAAVGDGRISPARKGHWVKAWEADPDGTAEVLASLEPGLVVPTVSAGSTGNGEEGAVDGDTFAEAELKEWASQLGIDPKGLTV